MAKAEVVGFTFEAKACQRKAHEVFCTITVVNNSDNARKIGVGIATKAGGGKPLLVDNLGNQYKAKRLWFGGKTESREGCLNVFWCSISENIPPNLPMNMVYSYDDIITAATSLSILLPVEYEQKYYQVVLREIPLSR